MKVKSKKFVHLEEKVPVYDLVIGEENPCFSLDAGVLVHNTIPWSCELREIYIPRVPHSILCHYDYSGAEIRLLAAVSKEDKLIAAFDRGEDVHRFVASIVWNKPIDQVKDAERRFSKMCTFSILYGKSIEAFAEEFMHGDYAAAAKLFDDFYRRFPKIKDYIDQCHESAERDGVVQTLFGDYLPITGNNIGKIKRASVNWPIQGTSSGIAAIGIWNSWEGCQMEGVEAIPVSFCHDAADWEVAIKDIIPFLKIVKQYALDDVRRDYGVPVAADFEIGFSQFDQIAVSLKEESESGILLEFHGAEQALRKTVQGLRSYFDTSLVLQGAKEKYMEASDLFMPHRAFSKYFGTTQQILKGEMLLIPKF